ncbi:hypothetical protein FJV41_16225 [Myxococcus llanfairpwllgwyngyllgogerychwyrndrobwllllantysiliogogogochensis]|uniref:Peptidase n=2 Tax=Myxococcaceae TaxID=31 RepID=A0A540X154_9BACT|nr:hypothetical protein FJV41_16225 [Myxococcus llanfairpwllgwyngyllgogerychwyrndrobwllllantysiliogogogochensis]
MSRSRVALAVAVFGFLGAVPSTRAAPTADPADNMSSSTLASALDEARILAYWTPERMASAIPAVPPTTSGKAPISLKPVAPENVSRTVDGAEPRGGLAPLADIHTMSGKVFYTDGGQNYVCSGSTVYSNGRRVVFTAGHCVHGGGSGRNWFSNWAFVPNYHSGSPHGTWTSTSLWSKNGWTNNGDRAYDVGAAVMNDRNGTRIVDAVGGQGIKWGAPYGAYIYQFGYPAAPPFNGSQLLFCQGGTWNEGGFPSISCNMTGGASGGPWLESYGQNYWAYLYSVNSWMFWDSDPTMVNKWQGPYFSYDTAGSLYDAVKDL